jgi:hypothetical protein
MCIAFHTSKRRVFSKKHEKKGMSGSSDKIGNALKPNRNVNGSTVVECLTWKESYVMFRGLQFGEQSSAAIEKDGSV